MIDKLAMQPSWQTAKLAALPELKRGELHLWCLPLHLTAQQSKETLNWINDYQRNKYNSRTNPELKQAYLTGRHYLLTLLAAYSNTSPQDIHLSYTRLKKPYLSDQSAQIHFNFTDTKPSGSGTALVAVSREGEVGVDVECLSRRGNFKSIVESRFTLAEQKLVTRADGEIDPELFLCLWTRKEASGKATGQGINFKMNQRELIASKPLANNLAQLNYTDERQQLWRLTQLRLDENFIACVAYEGHQNLAIRAFNLIV